MQRRLEHSANFQIQLASLKPGNQDVLLARLRNTFGCPIREAFNFRGSLTKCGD